MMLHVDDFREICNHALSLLVKLENIFPLPPSPPPPLAPPRIPPLNAPAAKLIKISKHHNTMNYLKFHCSAKCSYTFHFPTRIVWVKVAHSLTLVMISLVTLLCKLFLLLHLSISPGSKKSHFAAQATQFNTDNFLLFKG